MATWWILASFGEGGLKGTLKILKINTFLLFGSSPYLHHICHQLLLQSPCCLSFPLPPSMLLSFLLWVTDSIVNNFPVFKFLLFLSILWTATQELLKYTSVHAILSFENTHWFPITLRVLWIFTPSPWNTHPLFPFWKRINHLSPPLWSCPRFLWVGLLPFLLLLFSR